MECHKSSSMEVKMFKTGSIKLLSMTYIYEKHETNPAQIILKPAFKWIFMTSSTTLNPHGYVCHPNPLKVNKLDPVKPPALATKAL